MITVTHVLDDTALGGVTRFLDALEHELGASVQQSRVAVAPRTTLPPTVSDDVIVVHFTMSWAKLPFLLALRARRGRRPIVLVEHSYSEAFERKFVHQPWRFRAMLRLAYGLVDRVVSVSYGQAAWLRRARLLAAEKLSVIAPFPACGALASLPLPPAHDGPLKLGAYGRYCAQKDFSTLIAAMRLVDPASATLTIRGFGPDMARLQAEAQSVPHVTIGDRVDNLAEFLNDLDAVAVPSCFEPFGQVALEARLAGRPVIVSDVDGLPEQVEPQAGLIVPPEDPLALAHAIHALAAARTNGSLAGMGSAARETARNQAHASAQAWLSLLSTLLPLPARKHRSNSLKPDAAGC